MSQMDSNLEDLFSILLEDHSLYLNTEKTSRNLDARSAACIIQRTWRKFYAKRIFSHLRAMLYNFSVENPSKLLKRINSVEGKAFERMNVNVVFRLDGQTFPPVIVYKLFSKQVVINVCDDEKMKKSRRRTKGAKRKTSDWGVFYVYRARKKTKRVAGRNKFVFQFNGEQRRVKKGNIKWIHDVYNI
uniref:Uncharacterized protein n=1 Tax=Photinus pyralis TaxID=7054 RepID=A0A1Y1KCG8_PHOPY